MDPLITMIVDLLRSKKETELLNQGGTVVDPKKLRATMPVGTEPKHRGAGGMETYDDIVDRMSR